jgi:phosphate transport system permease protein
MRHVVLPYSKVGVIGGVMLGLGRALGETMAVTFVIGNAYTGLGSLAVRPGNSIASALANEFAEAEADGHGAALIAIGLILFVISLCRAGRRPRRCSPASTKTLKRLPRWTSTPVSAAACCANRVTMALALSAMAASDWRSSAWHPRRPARRSRASTACRSAASSTQIDPAAGLGRRSGQRDRRQPDRRWASATFVGHAHRHLAGIYLAEYGEGIAPRRASCASSTTCCCRRPSIVIGLFVYHGLRGERSDTSPAWPGAIALALIVDPGRGPHHGGHAARWCPARLREAAVALGMPNWK